MHPRDAYGSEPGVILRAHYFFYVLSAVLRALLAVSAAADYVSASAVSAAALRDCATGNRC